MNKEYFSVKEVAEYSGFSIHTIYKKIRLKEIPHIKIGSKVLFPKERIDEWLNNHLVEENKDARKD